nr:MAG TPA: hypothetical protein [Caudoviricetes sp.]
MIFKHLQLVSVFFCNFFAKYFAVTNYIYIFAPKNKI